MHVVAAYDVIFIFTRQRMQRVELFGGKSAAMRGRGADGYLVFRVNYRLLELSGVNPPEYVTFGVPGMTPTSRHDVHLKILTVST